MEKVKSLDSVVTPVKEQAEAVLMQLKDRLAPVDEWVRETSKERPLLLLGGAFAIGYLFARMLRR